MKKFLIFILFFLFSCGNSQNDKYTVKQEDKNKTKEEKKTKDKTKEEKKTKDQDKNIENKTSEMPKVLIEEPEIMPVYLTKEEPVYGGVLKLRLPKPPLSFNLYGALDSLSSYMFLPNVFDGLLEENPVNLELIPGLAKSWEANEEEKTITFHLRKTKWSDGVDFTADDVIFTMKNFVLNQYAEGNSIARFTINGKLIKFEKVDDYTLKAILPENSGAFLRSLSSSNNITKAQITKIYR